MPVTSMRRFCGPEGEHYPTVGPPEALDDEDEEYGQ
jgi:hypothetical protein